MFSIEVVVAAIGARLDGIVPGWALDAAGITAEDLRPLRRRGVLVLLGNRVYRLRDHPWTWRSRLRAALELAGPGAVVGLRSAARLHGYYAYRNTDAIEILVPRRRKARAGIGRVVQTRVLHDSHVTEIDGFPVTTVARTFFDLCGDPDDGLPVGHPAHERRMRWVYNDAVGRRGLRFVHEAAILAALARQGRSGTRLVRKLLRRFGDSYEPTRSDVESLFVDVLDAFSVQLPENQVKVSGVDGFIGVVDFLWCAARLVVEVDSAWHDGPLDIEADTVRDERLAAAGYAVKRFRYRELVLEPERVVRELVTVLGRSGP